MSAIRTLENSSNGIIYEMPPGKPDPSQPRPIGKDTRARVYQKAQTAAACTYYVFNFIRTRIGKNAPPSFNLERSIEKACSERRKEISKVSRTIDAIVEDMMGKNRFEISTTQEEKMLALQIFSEFSHVDTNTLGEAVELIHKTKMEKRLKINMQFFETLKINFQDLFKAEMTFENGYVNANWSDFQKLTTQRKLVVYENLATIVMAQKYGLKKSTWTPACKINDLIQELKTHGPLAVKGLYGRSTYSGEPFKLKGRVGERDLYGWKRGSPRKPTPEFAAHICLIVGARKGETQDVVFFIDPHDPSDPRNRSLQKIYIVSYRSFTEYCLDFHGRTYSEKLAKPGKIERSPPWSKVEYAYHGS